MSIRRALVWARALCRRAGDAEQQARAGVRGVGDRGPDQGVVFEVAGDAGRTGARLRDVARGLELGAQMRRDDGLAHVEQVVEQPAVALGGATLLRRHDDRVGEADELGEGVTVFGVAFVVSHAAIVRVGPANRSAFVLSLSRGAWLDTWRQPSPPFRNLATLSESRLSQGARRESRPPERSGAVHGAKARRASRPPETWSMHWTKANAPVASHEQRAENR